MATTVSILLATVEVRTRVRVGSLIIHDVLNDAPNTCRFTIDGTAPTTGQVLRVLVDGQLLFNGTIQTVELSYEGLPSQLAWACTAIDDSARANRKRPFGTWTTVSATTIAQDLIADFAPGFTDTNVEAGLPAISIIFDGSETLTACLARIAQAIGGYFYFEDLDLHLFLTEVTATPDDLDHTAGRFLDDPAIALSTDDSQLRTRVYGKGHGVAVLADVAASAPIVPVDDAVMFNPSGGQVIAGTTPAGAQSEILDYTGVHLGGAGALVGPGAAPSVAPTLALAPGAGIELGGHDYAYTFVSAAGESLPGPLGNITTRSNPAPTSAVTRSGVTADSSAFLDNNSMYTYAYTYVRAEGETSLSPTAGAVFGALTGWRENLTGITVGPAGTLARKLYRSHGVPGSDPTPATALFLLDTIADNTTTTYGDIKSDGALGAAAPTTNAIDGQQVALTGIALGPTGTTARKIYRTVAAGAQLKLQQTIADNTTTTGVTDATPDASLGANVPTGDTSGLSTVTGQVNAGSATIETTGAGPFTATGGWVRIGQQVIRYTGITGNTLTGIPASGSGALLNTVTYGEHVDVVPALLGVTGNALAMQKGSAVHLWIQRDDLVAQAARAAIDGGDGIYEHLVSDARRGEASLTALCDAELALFAYPIQTLTYASRDLKTKSGKPIVVALTSPPITTTLTIQDVTISEIDVAANLKPRFTVTASSVRFSLPDLLRRLLAAQVAA